MVAARWPLFERCSHLSVPLSPDLSIGSIRTRDLLQASHSLSASSSPIESPIVRDVLDNGLRILTERMTQVRSVSIGVWLTRGSRHETGRARRHRALRRAHALQGHGDADRPRTSRRRSTRSAASSTRSPPRNTRATTSRCSTSTCRSRSTSSPTSSATRRSAPDDIEREKKVVLEEIKMVEDTPDDLVHELFTQGFWEDHPLGRPILGTKETVESFNADAAARLLRRRLHRAEPDRLGGRQPRARARARAGRRRSSDRCRRRASRPASRRRRSCRKILIRNKELEQSHVCLGVGSYPQNHDDRYASYVLNTLLGGSMSSRLFQNVREKRGLAYAVFSGLSAYRDAGSFTIYAGCSNEAVGEVIDLCVEELRGVKQSAGARRGAAAGEGSSEGQPDAEPREHGEPHVAPGAAGDLLRPAVRPRRNAARASSA